MFAFCFLQELAHAVGQQSQQLAALAQQLLLGLLQSQQQQQQQQLLQDVPASTVALLASLCDRHRMAVSSLMMATAPFTLPGECSAVQLLRHLSGGNFLSIRLMQQPWQFMCERALLCPIEDTALFPGCWCWLLSTVTHASDLEP
jgi:hypothetical protein